MKKLLTMLSAAVTAFGLQAADPYPSGTSFNDESWPSDAEKVLWTSMEDLTISETPFTLPTGVEPPAQFKLTDPGNNLHIARNLTNATFRAIVEGAKKQSIGSGVCVDTMIKFTAFDQEDTASIEGMDAKFAIWVKEIEGADGEASTYQLMVTAGKKEGLKLVRKDYVCASSKITDMEAWYRLTVKVIEDITNGGQIPGFVVCINGEAVTSGEAMEDVAALDLSSEGAQWNSNGAIFPALISNDLTIRQVGFAGTGWIDDLSFTDTIPEFVATKAAFRIIGGDHVKSFKYGDKYSWDKEKSLAALVITDASAPDKVTDIVYEDGYFGDTEWSVTKEKDVLTTVGNAKPEAASVTIDGTKTPYATIDEALTAVNAATSEATLKLGADSDTYLEFENANEEVVVKLDLAGKTLTAGVYAITKVIILDSVGGGKVDGEVLGEGEFDKRTLEIQGGKFLVSKNTEGIDAILPDGMKLVKDEAGEYWMLGEKGEGVTFTVTAAAHTTATVEIDGATVESIPESLTVGQTYTVTFTAADGYAFAEDARTVFEGTVADTDVTIEGPAVTAIEYAITYKWTGVEEADLENIQNANPTTYTIESETITFANPTCEGYTFKGFDRAEIATGSTGDVTVTGTFEKNGSTKPTTWDEVTDDTAVVDLPGVTTEQATTLETAGVKASAVATWATGSGNVTIGDAINLDAFIMDAANTATADELAAKAAAEITQEVLDAIVAAGTEADVTAIAKKYPNATVKVIPATEIESTDTAKFFKLQFTLKGAE